MKAAKRIGTAAAVLLALVVAIVVGAFLYIDSIARAGIEKGATYALGVKTSVQGVSVGVIGGSFSMRGLEVANPAGFTSPHFLKLGATDVAVSLGSLRKDTVELPLLSLADLDVSLERREGKSNYQTILDNVGRLQKGGDAKARDPGKDKKLVIRELVLQRITVRVDVVGAPGAVGELVSKVTKVTIPIDEIRLNNVGKTGEGVKGTGVTLAELSGIIVQAILAAAAEKGGDLIPTDLLGDLKGQLASLDSLGDMGMKVTATAKGVVEGAGKAVEEAGKKVGEELEKVGEGIRGIFDRDKK